jgi:transposase-like protein
VLELLQNKSTLVQIASKHNILPQNLQNWKKTFLANAEIAMEPSKAVKEYKEELDLFKHLCDVIFDGLLSVVCPWFVIQATSINTQ